MTERLLKALRHFAGMLFIAAFTIVLWAALLWLIATLGIL